MSLTEKDVERVLRLAKLKVTPEEKVEIKGDLERMIGFFAQLAEFDVPESLSGGRRSGAGNFSGGASCREEVGALRDDVAHLAIAPERLREVFVERQGPYLEVPRAVRFQDQDEGSR